MGPTCAKRSAGGPTSISFETQLSFLDDEPLFNAPIQADERRTPRRAKALLPKVISERADLAKTAFDELQREFSQPMNVYYGEEARLRFEELIDRRVECHSFGDPSLAWLAPEYDIHLLIDHKNRLAYYWRIFNESHTLIMIDPRSSREARNNIAIILGFSEALATHRAAENEFQLSFSCQMTVPALAEV